MSDQTRPDSLYPDMTIPLMKRKLQEAAAGIPPTPPPVPMSQSHCNPDPDCDIPPPVPDAAGVLEVRKGYEEKLSGHDIYRWGSFDRAHVGTLLAEIER